MDQKDLNSNKTDLFAAVAKSVLGAVPVAGSLLSELVGNIIPNQRIDRLTKYILQLDEKVSKIPLEKINQLLNNEEFIDLIEEGFVQAARAISDERRKYIASLVSNGITDEKIKFEESKMLLKILQELSDIEIIWLRSFLLSSQGEDDAFRKKHQNILTQIIDTLGSDENTKSKSAIQKSYKEHLERLELINYIYKIDRKTGIAEFDKYSGQQRKAATHITILGRLLLKQIGIINELNPK
jgi:hypothetical protein